MSLVGSLVGRVVLLCLLLRCTVQGQNTHPIFESPSYNFELAESEPAGTTIGMVSAFDSEGDPLTYVLQTTSEDAGFFRINSASGVITTSMTIDRENLISPTLRFFVRVNDPSDADALVQVIVTVTDVNDNSPTFLNLPRSLELPENTPVSTSIYAADAEDIDQALNAAILYSLIPSDTFSIDSTTGVIMLAEPLDFDNDTREHILNVFAQDRALNNSMTSQSLLTITVTDINDLDPRFDPELYAVGIFENLTMGSQVVRVSAFDQDRGIDDDIIYAITGGNLMINGTPSFYIDDETGWIAVNVPSLDREEHPSYSLVITGTERTSTSNRASATVLITILDINDHIPIFDMPQYETTISELASVNDSVLMLTARDRDEGVHGSFTFSLLNVTDEYELPFDISSETFQNMGTAEITLTQELDFESQIIYRFIVVATEIVGESAQSNYVPVTVNVENENDNTPVFQPATYSEILPENIAPNSFVVLVRATDGDAGTFGNLSFSLSNDDSNKPFDIFTQPGGSGVIMTNRALNYEEVRNYTLTVRVEDLAEMDRRSDLATVIVDVINLNDNPPQFVNDEGTSLDMVTVPLLEELPRAYTILTARAVDADGPLTDLSFAIESETPPLGHFTIDEETGVINTTLALDYDLMTANRFPTLVISVNDTDFVDYLTVNIEVVDINDNSPQFENDTYGFDVVENTLTGIIIGQVQATDIDSGTFGQVQYSLYAGPYDDDVTGRLAINSSSGDIYLLSIIDREETPGPFQFTVIASDLDSDVAQRNMDNTSVTVYVIDQNDNTPSFLQDEYRFSIAERTGQFSGLNVSADDPDEGNNGIITYSILEGNEEGVFILDPYNGEITSNVTSVLLDFERTQMYTLNISAEDSGYPSNVATVLVYIQVLDENDVTPMFSMPSYNTSIDEDISSGSSIATVTAQDDDSGLLGTVVYNISSVTGAVQSNGTFTIDENGVVYTEGSFDYEAFNGPYIIMIVASDRGEPPNNASTTLTVNILDVNDEMPTFAEPQLEPSPNEEGMTGYVVAVLSASDGDEPGTENSRITYSITDVRATPAPDVSLDNVEVRQHFALDPQPSGVDVVTNTSLDFEMVRAYDITVTARDNGDPTLSSEVTLTVTVLDINDHAPEFIFTGNNSVYSVEIFENSPFQRFTDFFLASDEDSTSNGMIEFIPSNGLTFPDPPFSIVGNQLIVEGNSLNFEQIQSYRFNVTARDMGSPPMTDEAEVVVTVLDVNDNSPVFLPSDVYTTDIDEGNYTNASAAIVLVNATDVDSEEFGNIFYEVFPADPLFSVVTLATGEGEIRVEGELDRETMDQHIITILARDGGMPPNTATARVIINVNDVNDNAPILNARQYAASISENELPTLLTDIVIMATDADIGRNGEVQFLLVNDTDFTINLRTAEVRSEREFDFETERTFVLDVIAFDNVTDPLTDTAQLTITITDQNDNTPYFVNIPSNLSYPEDTPVGTTIATITADDRDSSINAELVFQLANDEGRFAIDNNGVITLASSLDRESTGSYNISVTVSDRGQSPLSATEYVYIEVTDVNDVAPQLETDSYSFVVAEDVALNTTVGEIVAFDLDEDINGDILFEIVSGNTDLFSLVTMQIDSRQTFSSVLVNNMPFDYETMTSHALTVMVRNIVPPYFNRTADVIVSIRDTNDNPPIFSLPLGYVITVPEAAAVARPVGTVVATDEDGGINGTVSYAFAPGTNSTVTSTFAINNTTGVIQLSSSLNFENTNRYDFYVEARDLSVVPLTSNVSVAIIVEDTNENAPRFDMNGYSAQIGEELPPGQVVTQVTATESETGGTSVRYSLVAGATQQFIIDEITGIISTNASVDREIQDNYVLTVQARDSAALPLSSFVQVAIQVTDINDNKPVFGIASPQVNLPESSPMGTRLPEVFLATDRDIGTNAEIRYSVIPSDTFEVDPQSGVISVRNPSSLDREATDRVLLTLRATDNGSPDSQSSDLMLEVILDDINDNTPRFIPASYTATIRENSDAGIPVVRVTAVDLDLEPALRYSIISGDDAGADKFQINEESGLIETTSTLLDRETRSVYELVVAATDSGVPSRTNTSMVTVIVMDANEHTPQCDQMPFTFTTDEDNLNQVFLGRVTATDRDGVEVPSGQLVYRLASSSVGNRISVNSAGDVFGRPGLDFEEVPGGSFVFGVIVQDQPANDVVRTNTCQVMVTLRDVNDNIPMFTETLYEAAVTEGATFGTRVTIVNANDLDSGSNGQVRYSIPSTSVPFSINPTSGEVTVSGILDSDTNDLYILDVEATDLGSSPRIGTTQLRVSVLDTNDNSPRFERTFYERTISENVATDTSVIQVLATDRDSASNSDFPQYSIISGNTDGTFRIEPSGVILNTRTLDREAIPVFNLVISAEDEGGNNGTAVVRVVIMDENDESPMFQQTQYTASINENSLEGTAVLPSLNGSSILVQAIDADEPNTDNSRVIYTLEGDDAASFSIDASSGTVTVARGASLNFEVDPVLEVTVVATDSDPVTPRSSSATLTINLIDINDMAPMFTSPLGYVFRVREDAAEGIIFTRISAMDPETVGGMIRYELVSAIPFSVLDQFSINRTSGELSLVESLDRETDPTITLTVAASDMGEPALSSVVNVQIAVTDVNDNPPRFSQDIYTTTVPEFLAVGMQALRVTATDPDAPGINSMVDYQVLDTAAFTILATGDIVTTGTLDHETTPFYQFRVQACDRGAPMQCNTTMIRINVADFNDHSPTFDQGISYYTDICLSSADSGVDLVQPVATDADSTSNAELTYSLMNEPSLFSVDSSSGRISLAQEATAGDIGSHEFTIVAADGGDTPLSGSTTVTIRLLNCSQQDFYFLMPFHYLEIDEGVERFTDNTATVLVGISRTAQLVEFFPEYAANPFTNTLNNIRLKPSADLEEELRQGMGLDREARSLYTITLRADDGAGLETFTSVTLRVLDVNDNPPAFPSDLVLFDIPENETAPYAVGSVQASDLDDGPIIYSVLSISPISSPLPFSVNSTSGLISTATELDRESVSQYDVEIGASDGMTTVSTMVRVTVQDINDCAPTFVEDEYRVEISENLPAGSRVAVVSATDCDVGANAQLRYSIAAGSLGVFQLDLISGMITTLTSLDFEQTPSYSLTITAADMGLPVPLSGTASVFFTVVDFNDCPPEFLNPPTEVRVREDIRINSVLATFSVRDCDSGLNGVNGTRFSIVTGNEEVFALNVETGVLTTVSSLDREEQATYFLSIRAMDSAGINSLSSITELTIIVEDFNDHSPVFAEDQVSIRISEGEDLNQVLLTLTATDEDIDRNSEIRYSLVGGEDIFSINEENGGIFLANTLDRETTDSYALNVVARDNGLEPRSSNATILVTVLDENDNDPEILNIESGATMVDVSEDTSPGTVIFRVNATDADLGANANIMFSLDDVSANFPFTLTGDVVMVSDDLDFEQRVIYSLVVIAEDTGQPTSRRSIATLVVQVTDSNDNNPMFVETDYVGEQDEGEMVGTSILRVQANDADTGDNAAVEYSFADGFTDAQFFSIDNETGIISNNITLDRESIDSYSFDVVATNYLTPGSLRTGTASVTITVGDVNDETPSFSSPLYTSSLAERTPVNTFVLRVSAQDNDLANTPNSDLVYSLSRVENIPFFIDPNTGVLTVQNTLDYETATVYNFDVVVEDKGAEPLRNTSTVIVNITDLNDQAPTFSQPIYTVTLFENSPPATILSFQYSDGDTSLQNTESRLQITSVDPANGGLFSINMEQPGSGTITLNDYEDEDLDFESVESYSLGILVQNTGERGIGEACPATQPNCMPSSSAVVNVNIVDVNDNPPEFLQSTYTGEVSSTALTGTSILAVRATDADASLNFRSIIYRLGASGPNTQFRIGNTTGTLFTRGSFEGLDGSVYTITVEALDNNGMEPFNIDTTTIQLTVLRDFQRIAIIFNISVDIISAKENEIVSLLRNLTGYEIVVEQYREYSTDTLTTFIFHAIENGDIIDFDQFFSENLENELFNRLERCRIIRIQSFGDVIVPQGPLDREIIVILVLCLFLIVGAIILLIASFSQRYLALHANRNKLLADVFYGSHAGSSLILDNLHQENIQLQLMDASGQTMNKQNPMFVQPYDNWAGVDTSGVESVGGDSNLQRDNPLYESQEIRMEMFADVSDEEEEEDEADEAELLAAALQDDSEGEDEDNSVTAI